MADIATAETFAEALDPQEVLDYTFELHDLLEPAETILPTDWTLEIPVEGAGLGLIIMTGEGRDPALVDGNRAIKAWLTIDDDMKSDPIFDGGGTAIPLVITGETNSTPYRVRQRTAKLKVMHR